MPREPQEDYEVELTDDALEIASAGVGSQAGPALNSTLIVYASTFIPFDDSFG